MWKRVLDRVVVPILFVSVGSSIATLLSIRENELATQRKAAQIEAEIEAKKAEAEAKRPKIARISSYDAIFKEIAKKHKLDWRLLAALAKAESGFRSNAVSRSGAVGLMQIMPNVAKSLGYTREQLFDARTSVDLAAQVLHKNRDMLRLPEEISEREQWQFILACYNAGYGRVTDARALARHHSTDANKWSEVAPYLSKLAEPQYARLKVVKLGIFRGSKETLGHVKKVMNLYDEYIETVIP
jgi:membrane-bound lytic murein transglycosylase MltF